MKTVYNQQSGESKAAAICEVAIRKQVLPIKMFRNYFVARREWYIGEGVFGARERDIQRLSYADFFGYFLVRRQESNILRLLSG